MKQIRFYHLTTTRLEQALPPLLEKTMQRGWRAVVRGSSDERIEHLTQHLWSYDPASFLPHGNKKDGNAEVQPIYLTSEEENPNEATVLFAVDGSDLFGEFDLSCLVFDANDPDQLAKARAAWKKYKDTKADMTYWQQTNNGWQKKEI